MAKVKTVWACSDCGHTQVKWSGQCTACTEWNTLHQEIVHAASASNPSFKIEPSQSKPLRIKDISDRPLVRLQIGLPEFNRMIGGGIVPGSLSLIGGDPGIGKSTLSLQIAHTICQHDLIVLYVCGEESIEQTSLRAQRLGISHDNLYLLNETSLSTIRLHIDTLKPHVLIIDSIQIIYKEEISSAPGSVSQVRECASELMHLAKSSSISTFLIGHVTKSGELAGPRVLEHLVDTVLYFEGDKQHNFRMIRVIKNRFGPTDEIAVFQMQSNGLKEVSNPSQIFLDERMKGAIGSVIIATIEGSRPILVEAQALVTKTVFATPSRRSTGIDPNRLALLLAVLEKRSRYPMHQCDVFVSLAGGIRINEPATDLGILLSIASSFRNCVVDPEMIIIGEVGLGGEIRSVPRIESRIKEAIQLGFKKAVIPKRNIKGISSEMASKIQLKGIDWVDESLEYAL